MNSRALILLGGGVLGLALLWPKKALARERRLASRAGVPIAVMRAIAQVESAQGPIPEEGWPAGKGKGKLHAWGGPKLIRFEPHVFNRKVATSQHMPSVNGNSASSRESEVRDAAFHEAFRRAPSAAIEATSWGRFQVLGSFFLEDEYNGDPERFLNEWTQADYQEVEDMGDVFLTYWFNHPWNSKAQQLANTQPMTQDALRELGKRYNGSYNYYTKFGPAYAEVVAQGAPTALA